MGSEWTGPNSLAFPGPSTFSPKSGIGPTDKSKLLELSSRNYRNRKPPSVPHAMANCFGKNCPVSTIRHAAADEASGGPAAAPPRTPWKEPKICAPVAYSRTALPNNGYSRHRLAEWIPKRHQCISSDLVHITTHQWEYLDLDQKNSPGIEVCKKRLIWPSFPQR
ncbi:hypothetical protein Salat_1649800 [Sesamum alatum]|uniref:Uncharacterized protein n=1 Tax=Sesamum alatum TaxID=300844 RepID=A0AAE2CJK7_9LAMI|nr:hypothetical protein Salat_1649800 [Sesamum alatum]